MVNFFRLSDEDADIDMLVNMDLISTISKTLNGKARIAFLKSGSDCPSSFTTLESYDDVLCALRDFIK